MAYHLNIIRQEYGRRILLHDLRQDYAAGRIHGFLGENGVGKTTLFRCMAGRLSFEGEPMFSPETRVGFLPAELYMYPMITGREFLQFYVTALLTEYRRRGQTVFVASHDLDHLLSYADTLSWLRSGTMTCYPDRTAFEDVRQAIRREAAERVEGADLL